MSLLNTFLPKLTSTRAAAAERALAAKAQSLVEEREARRAATEKALQEAGTGRVDWSRIKWLYLKFLLLVLITCFALSAFNDYVNFKEGVGILLAAAKQLLVVGAVAWIVGAAFKRWEEREDSRQPILLIHAPRFLVVARSVT